MGEQRTYAGCPPHVAFAPITVIDEARSARLLSTRCRSSPRVRARPSVKLASRSKRTAVSTADRLLAPAWHRLIYSALWSVSTFRVVRRCSRISDATAPARRLIGRPSWLSFDGPDEIVIVNVLDQSAPTGGREGKDGPFKVVYLTVRTEGIFEVPPVPSAHVLAIGGCNYLRPCRFCNRLAE